MWAIAYLSIWAIFIIIIRQISGISYNRPKFCSNASWNPNGTTFANNSTVGLKPYEVFVSSNNLVYVANQQQSQVIVWNQGNVTPWRILLGTSSTPWSLFATIAGDIYIDSSNSTGRVDKWAINSTYGIPTMYTCQKCADLFMDMKENLYCSMSSAHRVVRLSLLTNSTILTNVAGTGSGGNSLYMLNTPFGIFLDSNSDLYVADSNNNRIQLFRAGQLRGTTVAGNQTSSMTISLRSPTGIALDADGYLFIVDKGNNRIIGSGPNGFRCIAGCFNTSGSTSRYLSSPYTLSFDSYGNIYVADWGNSRIQKFYLMNSKSCDQTTSTTSSVSISLANDVSTTVPQSDQTDISFSNVVSYNQPKFCPEATWNPNAITFAANMTVGWQLYGMFIDTNNTVYVVNRQYGQIFVWFNDSNNSTQIIPSNVSTARGLFVTSSGDIYIDNGYLNGQVEKWSLGAYGSVPVMSTGQQCLGLFVDINDTLYCTLSGVHQVVTKSLNNGSELFTSMLGTGCSGSAANQLYLPYGIFVTTDFDLYIADYGNHRIQFFRAGEVNATTVAGNQTSNITISLYNPTGIAVDADGYLFIVDKGNNRIIGSGPNGFRCIVGCTNTSGSAPNQLNAPQILSFDSFGNIFVTEWYKARVQKFLFLENSCDTLTTEQSILISMMEEVESSSNVLESTALTLLTNDTSTSTLSTTEITASTSLTTGVRLSTVLSIEISTSTPLTTGAAVLTLSTTAKTSFTPMTTKATGLISLTTRISASTPLTSEKTVLTSLTTGTVASTPLKTVATTSPSPTATSIPLLTNTVTPAALTSVITVVSHQAASSSSLFVPLPCADQSQTGSSCNISSTLCNMIKPCQNNGSCINNNSAPHGYTCACLSGFNGTQCQISNQSCKADTCWNNGVCNETSNTSFTCSCQSAWRSVHCETKIDHCVNITCLNNGICRSLLLNYTCECLGTSYSGRHCEIIKKGTVIRRMVSRSLGYVGIVFLISVMMFFVIMDALKYIFGTDPSDGDSKKIQRRKQAAKRKYRPMACRFVYINESRTSMETDTQGNNSFLQKATASSD